MTTLGRYLPAVILTGALITLAVRGGSYDAVARGEGFIVIWWVAFFALAFGLAPRARPHPAAVLALAGLLGLAAWTAVGLAWTESSERTVDEMTRVLGFAAALMLVVVTFHQGNFRLGAAGVAVAAAAICGLALASRLAPGVFSDALRDTGYERLRLGYPFNYWNALGSWAGMTVALTLSWSVHGARWWIRGAALAAVPLAASVTYLTYSRAALIGVLLAPVAVVVLSRHRWMTAVHAAAGAVGGVVVVLAVRTQEQIARGTGGEGAGRVLLVLGVVAAGCLIVPWITSRTGMERLRMTPRVARGTAAAVACAGLLALAGAGPGLADEAWDSFSSAEERSSTADPARRLTSLSGDRRTYWDIALDAFQEKPLQGMGAGTYEFAWNRDPRGEYQLRDAHSLYLETLAELGLPGALMLGLALGSLLFAAVRTSWSGVDPAAAGVVAGCASAFLVVCVTSAVDWIWESTSVFLTALVCAGLAVAARAAAIHERPKGWRRAGVLLALVGVVLQLPGLVAASSVRASQEAVRGGRLKEALSDASTAIGAEPWGARGRIQRALVLERAGGLALAAREARAAADREPANWTTWLILARIEAERNRVGPALRALERARANHPSADVFRQQRSAP